MNIEDGTEVLTEQQIAWNAIRLGRFTASTITKILVKGKIATFGQGAITQIYKKLGEVLTLEANEATSPAIRWGNEHEGDAMRMYQQIYNKECTYYGKENPMFFEYGEHAGGSPDFTEMIVVPEFGDAPVLAAGEIKCPFESGNHAEVIHQIKRGTFDLQEYDKDYYGQIQANMLFAKCKAGIFVSYDPRCVDHRFSVAYTLVQRDESYITALTERLDAAIALKKEYLTDIGYYQEEQKAAA